GLSKQARELQFLTTVLAYFLLSCPAETVDSTKLDCQPSGLRDANGPMRRQFMERVDCCYSPWCACSCRSRTATVTMVLSQIKLLESAYNPKFTESGQIEKTGFKVTLSQYLPVHCISGEQNLEPQRIASILNRQANARPLRDRAYARKINLRCLSSTQLAQPIRVLQKPDLGLLGRLMASPTPRDLLEHNFMMNEPNTTGLTCLDPVEFDRLSPQMMVFVFSLYSRVLDPLVLTVQARMRDRMGNDSSELTVPLYIKSAEWKSDVYFNFTRFGLYTDPPDPSCRMSGFIIILTDADGNEETEGPYCAPSPPIVVMASEQVDGNIASRLFKMNAVSWRPRITLSRTRTTRSPGMDLDLRPLRSRNESESLSHYYEFSLDVFTLDVCLNSKLLMSESINGSFSKETTLCGYKKGEKFSTISSFSISFKLKQDASRMKFEPCSEPGWISLQQLPATRTSVQALGLLGCKPQWSAQGLAGTWSASRARMR
uniref:DUF1619 domain-containing protein n=1 Tax=Macrostomum lignano TaxID=282301 RepID=A0A1I8F6L0_9PLAT